MKVRQVVLLGVVAGILLTLGGCNWLKVGYRWADSVILFKVNQYLDLSDEQEDSLEAVIAEKIRWHRHTQLPQYRQFLAQFKVAVSQELTPGRVEILFTRWAELQNALFLKLIPPAAALLLSTTEEQQLRLRKRLEADNQEMAKTFQLPEAERRSKRARWLQEIFENWIGPLTTAQEPLMIQFARSTPLQEELRLENRLQGQEKFFTQLQQKQTATALAALLNQLWVYDYQKAVKVYPKQHKEVKKSYQSLMVEVYKLMTEKQKTELLQNIDEMSAMFLEMEHES